MMNKLKNFLVIVISLSTVMLFGQSEITLDKIWGTYEYYPKGVSGFNFLKDGKSYAELEGNNINQYDIASGNKTKSLLTVENLFKNGISGELSDYTLSEDENLILIETGTERIYRHSTRAVFHVYDRKENKLYRIFNGQKIRYCTFSHDASKVAFVYNNNLYYEDIKNGKSVQITKDGEKNKIINGATDWVYEEEFAFAKAFYWSPDDKFIAFIRFDESEVPEYILTYYNNETYPEWDSYKYPKVGQKNSDVTAKIYNLKKNATLSADLGDLTDMYIPRLKWTADDHQLCAYKLNRHQNHLQLFLVNAENGKSKVLLEEKNKYYIDITDDLTFLGDKQSFIWSSEMNGYNSLYHYDMKGHLIRQLTDSRYDVTAFYGVDEKNGKLYYQSAELAPIERHVFELDMNGQNKKVLTPFRGSNSAQFSADYSYYVNTYSSINTPPTYTVFSNNMEPVRTIVDNADVVQKQKESQVNNVEFFDFKTKDDVYLNGWMIKPNDFDSSKKYPVFMYLYGGPGSQQVMNSWMGNNYWWFQMLADQGYLIACVDNRGTGGRGEEFKKMTYMKLGHYETIDQIEAARYLGSLPYTDASRIGIFGWSYGGYMSSLCLFKGADVFKAAIAVAPVTNWKWYDSVYTERYMRTYTENPDGYDENSPVNFADRLSGNYLLIHGMADDNVHFQNTAELTNALIKSNKQYDYYAYPNKNHGIYGGNTRLHLFTKMTNFVNEKL